MKTLKQSSFIVIVLTVLLFITAPVQAQPGKIKGHVFDKQTGDPIIGANIVVKGTTYGAVADTIGEFLIHSIPPGTYDVIASAIGYNSVTVEDVVISSNQTTTLDFNLKPAHVIQEEVIIEYERPEVELDASKSSRVGIDALSVVDWYAPPAPPMPAPGTPGYGYVPQPWPQHAEEFSTWQPNPWRSVRTDPLSTFSVDVDNASYTISRRKLNDGQLPEPESVRIEEFINYFNYDYKAPTGEDPFSMTLELADCPWNETHDLLHIGLKGKELQVEEMPPSNFVFLIDVSGSMDSPDKLPLLKHGMRMLARELRPQDRVAIVTYAGNAGLALPSTPGSEKDQILERIAVLQPGGSTAGAQGINLAYKIAQENFVKEGNNRIILATDGDFNVGTQTVQGLEDLIEEKRETGVFLTVLGFGRHNIKDNKMETLANKGNGNYYYVDSQLEAKKVLIEEMGGLYTIAKDVKLQLEFNPARVAEYRLIGYETRLLNTEDFEDDTKDAGEIGAGHTVTALYEIIPADQDGNEGEKDLRYQNMQLTQAAETNEIATMNIRYKQPDGDTSKLLTLHGSSKSQDFEDASETFRWSAAVAEFGLLLRESEEKGDASYDQVMAIAKEAKGKDDSGIRAEFIRLVEQAKILAMDQIPDDPDTPRPEMPGSE